jgi:hypothetical protein
MILRWAIFFSSAIFIASLLVSCQGETEFSKCFSISGFDKVENGDTLAAVKRTLGEPFEVFTHIDFGVGKKSFNVDGAVNQKTYPKSAKIRRVLVYSRSKEGNLDYLVYKVYIDPESEKVIGKVVYKTD